jgi:hypothetical protein
MVNDQSSSTKSTLYDKIYADHVVDGHTIYIDRLVTLSFNIEFLVADSPNV